MEINATYILIKV